MTHLLEVKNLVTRFYTEDGVVHAVNGISYTLDEGESLGIVGESGSGKSVGVLSIMGLIPNPPGRVEEGEVLFDDRDLLQISKEEMRRIRGRDISMIFQEPMTSLNPVLPIGRQVAEPLIVHKGLSKSDALAEAAAWLEYVKIPAARKRLGDYPHQLSGGMRQRVMIAMAMICRPKLLIADEPTTALDVTIQSQILALMLELKDDLNTSLLLITHDLGVVAQIASRVLVMYAGQIVEEGRMTDIFDQPFHPYTQGLLKCMPRLGDRRARGATRLNEITGTVPSPTQRINGCKFANRCSYVFERCKEQYPDLFQIRQDQRARCWLKRYPERRTQSG